MRIIFYIEISSQQIFYLIHGGNEESRWTFEYEVCFCREIKIVDFGTSKRLTGLHLCTEESVGKGIFV